VERHGGHERVRDNPEIALQVHAQLEGHKRASAAARDEPKFDRKELLELQRPLNKVLADSLPYYESKLLAQMEVIKDEINKSTQQIIARLEAGSHDKVAHPDVRYVWKDMVSFRVISKRRQDFEHAFSRGGGPRSKRECLSWFCMIIIWIAIPLRPPN
jgi:hypothetical protein